MKYILTEISLCNSPNKDDKTFRKLHTETRFTTASDLNADVIEEIINMGVRESFKRLKREVSHGNK